MRSIEIFSGCGGLALGLSRAGFTHDLMVEWDDHAVATIEHNRQRKIQHVRHWPIEQNDVRNIEWARFFDKLDLCAGGPPCQPFSVGGKHKGDKDSRDMWPEAIRAVRESHPRAFLFENVRGLMRPAFSDYLEWILANLRRPDIVCQVKDSYLEYAERLNASTSLASYDVIAMKVNAADFGAPQIRHRVIIAGVRKDIGSVLIQPNQTHSRERLLWDQWVTGEYWRRHGMNQPDDSFIGKMDQSVVRKLRSRKEAPNSKPWNTVRDAIAGLGDPDGKRNHIYQEGARVYPGHTGSPLDRPAKALKAGDHGVPGGENMMVRDDGTVRYFTIREAARLQGLPDTYLFPRSWTESMRQIGNAVPVQLSESLGRWMANVLGKRVKTIA